VVWFRAFDYLLLGKLTTFAIVLATYLLGISLGSLAFSRFTRPRMGNVALFAVLEGVVGLAGLLSMPLLAAVTSPAHRGLGIGVFFAVIFGVTLVLGGLLPLAGQLSSGPVTVLGRSIGNLYSANTLGSVVGSFGAGFLLIPLLGTGPTYFLAAVLNLAIAFAVALWHPAAKLGAKKLAAGAALAAAATGLWLSADWTTRYEAGASLRPGFQVIAKKEGPLQTVMVAQDPSGDRVLMGGPFQSGETVFTRRQTQRLQAQLPMLLHANPQRVLEIGYGVGEIARTVELYHPAELRLVEIDENMIPMANRYFGALNGHASEEPNVKTDIMDGRLFLRMTHEKFDVILSDSMILASEGSLRLYTLEHFEQARAHLNPGGMMICWLPMNVGVAKSLVIIKTFLKAFPNTRLWLPLGHNTEEAYLVGYRSADEMGVDLDAFAARYQTIAAPELSAFGWNTPALFFGSFRAGPERLAQLTAKVPFINRDLNPVVDFLPTDPPAAIRKWVATLVRQDPSFVLPALHAKGQGRALRAALPGELQQVHQADLAFLEGVDRLASYGDAPPGEVLAERDQATGDFRRALAHYPQHHAARVWIAMVDDLAESAQPRPAPAQRKRLLEEALSLDPTDVVAARGLAALAQAAGDSGAAARLRDRVRTLSPYAPAAPPTASRLAPRPNAP